MDMAASCGPCAPHGVLAPWGERATRPGERGRPGSLIPELPPPYRSGTPRSNREVVRWEGYAKPGDELAARAGCGAWVIWANRRLVSPGQKNPGRIYRPACKPGFVL